MSEWIDNLVSDAIRNPISKEPEITKQAELQLSDPNYLIGIDEQLAACRLEKQSILQQGARGDDVTAELRFINDEINELLECRALASKETTSSFQEKGILPPERLESAVEAFRAALATDPVHATDKLRAMYPDFSDVEIDQVKETYWGPVFGGGAKVEANFQGEQVGAEELGTVLDDLVTCTDEDEMLLVLEANYGITEVTLQEELMRRAISTSPDLEHRDPEEIYLDPHMQTTSPHSSDPGMMPMADKEKKETDEELEHDPDCDSILGVGDCNCTAGPDKKAAPDIEEDITPLAPSTEPMSVPGPVPAPQPAMPPAPPAEEMVTRRVELMSKLDTIADNLATLRTEMMKDLLPIQEQVKKEEPLLIEALRRIDGMQLQVGAWQAKIKPGKKGYDYPAAEKILAKVTEVAEEENQRIFKLIKQLEGTKAYRTEVAPGKETLELKRQKSSLDLEADAPQALKEWWAKFSSWFARTFFPQIESLEKGFSEMGDYLDSLQSMQAATPS